MYPGLSIRIGYAKIKKINYTGVKYLDPHIAAFILELLISNYD